MAPKDEQDLGLGLMVMSGSPFFGASVICEKFTFMADQAGAKDPSVAYLHPRTGFQLPPEPQDVPQSSLVAQIQSGRGQSQDEERFSFYSCCFQCSFDDHLGHDFCTNCGREKQSNYLVNNGGITLEAKSDVSQQVLGSMVKAEQGLALNPSSNMGLPMARADGWFPKACANTDLDDTDFDVSRWQGMKAKKMEMQNGFSGLLASSQICVQGGPTTLMIRNIPSPYTPDGLLQEWPNNGTYDFLYLPYSSRLQRNLTYVFINFTSPQAAQDFKCQWQKMRLFSFGALKPLNVGVADVQGRDENLRQLRKKRLLRTKVKQCQPIVFRDGARISLDEALEDLNANDAQPGMQRLVF